MAMFTTRSAYRWMEFGRSVDEYRPLLSEYMVFEMANTKWVCTTDGFKACMMSVDDKGVSGLDSLEEGSYLVNDITLQLVKHTEIDSKVQNIKGFLKEIVEADWPVWVREDGEKLHNMPSPRRVYQWIATWAVRKDDRSVKWLGWNVPYDVKKMLAEKYDGVLSLDAMYMKPLQTMNLQSMWFKYNSDNSGTVKAKILFRSPDNGRAVVVMPIMNNGVK